MKSTLFKAAAILFCLSLLSLPVQAKQSTQRQQSHSTQKTTAQKNHSKKAPEHGRMIRQTAKKKDNSHAKQQHHNEHALKKVGDVQHGKAAWYGAEHTQKITSSGERFNHNEFTAAHRTLPFGSVVKVTNLRTNKTCHVRVTDRGPVSRRLCIDISAGAAREIGMYDEGIGSVRLELVKKPG